MKTKNNKKNSFRKTMSYLFFFTILTFSSCNKDDTQPNCGCESETLDTVPSENFPEVPIEEQKSGILFYKTSEKVDGFYDDDQYNNRFWIFQGTEGCYNCKRNFIICNENLLGTEYDYLKNNNDSIEIKFTGDLKSLCVLRPILADYNYAEIVLTLIEQQ
jgi:hypothetical protein